jgi:hypothetical protein
MLNILDRWEKMNRVMISAVVIKRRVDVVWENVMSAVVNLKKKTYDT